MAAGSLLTRVLSFPSSFAGAQTRVRLVGGPSPQEGNAEVLVQGSWRPLCSTYLDYVDDAGYDSNEQPQPTVTQQNLARLVCEQLGFKGAPAWRLDSLYGPAGAGATVNLRCSGNETDLAQCTPYSFECATYLPAAGIACTGELQGG